MREIEAGQKKKLSVVQFYHSEFPLPFPAWSLSFARSLIWHPYWTPTVSVPCSRRHSGEIAMNKIRSLLSWNSQSRAGQGADGERGELSVLPQFCADGMLWWWGAGWWLWSRGGEGLPPWGGDVWVKTWLIRTCRVSWTVLKGQTSKGRLWPHRLWSWVGIWFRYWKPSGLWMENEWKPEKKDQRKSGEDCINPDKKLRTTVLPVFWATTITTTTDILL